MSKGLEAWERLKMFPIYQEITRIPQRFRDKESITIDLDIIEKELKALEIIRKKEVNIEYLLMTKSCDEYNKSCLNFGFDEECLTQEEYDLLKEVLSND